jgi:hypothetical protein
MIRLLIENAAASLGDLNFVQTVQKRTICGKNIAQRRLMDLKISPDQYLIFQKPLKLLYLYNCITKLGD